MKATIFVIDDDPAVRESLTLLLEQEEFRVETFEDGEAFLAAPRTESNSCAIVDVRMPNLDGPQLQVEMRRRGMALPVIFLTGHGDIPTTVRAMKAGAVDFLTKPVTRIALRASLAAALLESSRLQLAQQEKRSAASLVEVLTKREREVMALAVKGKSNKEIARVLGISHRTVEIHRARIMQKTGVGNLLELARLAERSRPQR